MSNLATIVNNILADSGIDDINVVVTTGSYTNPSWIVSLPWTKITGTPTTLAGYGITNAYTKTEVDTLLSGKQNTLTLTTTGTSGAATLVGATLNIPIYQSILTNPVTGTGTNNYVAKFNSTGSTIGNSLLQSTASNVFINQEDTSFGIDAQASTRIGFTKKGGAQPFLSYAADPFTIRSTTGTSIDASNTFVTKFSMAINGDATFVGNLQSNGVLRIDGTTDPNTTNAAYFWNAAGIGPTISGLNFQVRVGATQTTRLYVRESGFVGVNTVTPESNFVVSNDAGTQSIEINQLTANARIFAINRSTSAWLPLYINDSGGNVIIGSSSNNGSLFQANGEASFGAATEKLSMSSQALGFNRRVSNGTIYDTNFFAYQFQHTQGATNTTDYLALQVYNPSAGQVTALAWLINGAGNVRLGSLAGSGSRIVVADANGELSASSALSGYVPYTGANQNVNLGANSLQVNQKIGTTEGQGIFLRGIADATHKIYYNVSIPANIWEYNAPILFQQFNSGSPFTAFTFSNEGNLTAIGSVNGNGSKPQLTANGGASAGAQISLITGLSSNPTLRRNWAIVTEDQVEGDFAIKSSTTAGGTPVTTRLSILSDGMMGVNMTTPIYQFDITTANYKSFRIQSSDDALITLGSTVAASQFYSIGVSSATSGQGANLFWIGTSTNNPSGTLTKNFTLSATGAATFSSTVRATQFEVPDAGKFISFGGTQSYYSPNSGASEIGYQDTLNFRAYNGGSPINALFFASNGSATFNSSSGFPIFAKGYSETAISNIWYDNASQVEIFNNITNSGFVGAGAGIKFLLSSSGNPQAGIYGIRLSTTASGLAFYTQNANLSVLERARIDNLGNMGVGSTLPISRLSVKGVGGTTGVTLTLENGGGISALNDPLGIINFYSNDPSIGASGVHGSLSVRNEFNGNWDGTIGRQLTYMSFSTALAGVVSEKVRITSNGNLGVNNIAPQDKLDVQGEVLFGAQTERLSAGSASLAWNRRVATGQIYDSGRFAYQFQHTGSTSSGSDYLALQVYNNSGGGVTPTAFVVNGVGNTLLGTASDNSHRLRVEGSVYASGYMYTASESTGFVVDANPNAGLARVGLMKYGGLEGMLTSGNSTSIRLGHRTDSDYVLAGGTPTFRIDLVISAAGAATFGSSVTATSFFESSDSRIKTELEDVLDYAAIANVTAKYYEKNGKVELGYYAQDFEALMPSAISENEEGYLNLSYREVHTAKIAYLEKRINELEQQLKNK